MSMLETLTPAQEKLLDEVADEYEQLCRDLARGA